MLQNHLSNFRNYKGEHASEVIVAIYKLSDLPDTDDAEIAIYKSEPSGIAKTNNNGRIGDWAFHPQQDLNKLRLSGPETNNLRPRYLQDPFPDRKILQKNIY